MKLRPPGTSLPLGGSSFRGSSTDRHRVHHDLRILLMALGAGAPAVLISMIMLWGGDYTPKVQWTLSVLIVGFWLGFSFALRERVVFPCRRCLIFSRRFGKGTTPFEPAVRAGRKRWDR